MTGTPDTLDVIKGHGTGNDFVLLPDPDASVDLTADLVRALADRHRGVGGDGVIRIATAGALVDRGVLEDLPDGVAASDWFMDYRNGDGSVAEMCGNGVRVFAHSLHALGLTDVPVGGTVGGAATLPVGTRAGRRDVVVHSVGGAGADVSVGMGVPRVGTGSDAVMDGVSYHGRAVDMGNPHLACVVDGLTAGELGQLDFTRAPSFDPEVFPDGVNLEILTLLQDGAVHMRVHERGVGETLSCGTGTVAAAVAALSARFTSGERDWTETVTVNIPGGAVEVTVGADADGGLRPAVLRGPSRLVFRTQVPVTALL